MEIYIIVDDLYDNISNHTFDSINNAFTYLHNIIYSNIMDIKCYVHIDDKFKGILDSSIHYDKDIRKVLGMN